MAISVLICSWCCQPAGSQHQNGWAVLLETIILCFLWAAFSQPWIFLIVTPTDALQEYAILHNLFLLWGSQTVERCRLPLSSLNQEVTCLVLLIFYHCQRTLLTPSGSVSCNAVHTKSCCGWLQSLLSTREKSRCQDTWNYVFLFCPWKTALQTLFLNGFGHSLTPDTILAYWQHGTYRCGSSA